MSNPRRASRHFDHFSLFREGPDPASPIYLELGPHFDRQSWNCPAFEFPIPVPHVGLEVVYVPEGMRALACCHRCGGRHESLLDLRSQLGTNHTGALYAFIAQRIGAVLPPILDPWLPDHVGCDFAPRQHHLPSEVMNQLDRRLARAAKRLRNGRRVPTVIDVILEDGLVREVPVDDLPAETPDCDRSERIIEVAMRHFVEREWQRQRGVEVQGAVMVSEGYSVDDSAHGKVDSGLTQHPMLSSMPMEFIQVAVVTNSVCLSGKSEISRSGGRVGEGSGVFTRPDVSVPLASSLLLNGLLATNSVH